MTYDFYAYQRKRETQDLLGFKKYEEDHIMLAYRQKETENPAKFQDSLASRGARFGSALADIFSSESLRIPRRAYIR